MQKLCVCVCLFIGETARNDCLNVVERIGESESAHWTGLSSTIFSRLPLGNPI